MTVIDGKSFEKIYCSGCSIEYYVPSLWLQDKRETGNGFKCPNGCFRAYKETETDRIRRKLERAQQQLAYKDDVIRDERHLRDKEKRKVAAQKGIVTKLKKRSHAGVCVCCNRTFENLQRHMASKHPNELQVIDGGKSAA